MIPVESQKVNIAGKLGHDAVITYSFGLTWCFVVRLWDWALRNPELVSSSCTTITKPFKLRSCLDLCLCTVCYLHPVQRVLGPEGKQWRACVCRCTLHENWNHSKSKVSGLYLSFRAPGSLRKRRGGSKVQGLCMLFLFCGVAVKIKYHAWQRTKLRFALKNCSTYERHWQSWDCRFPAYFLQPSRRCLYVSMHTYISMCVRTHLCMIVCM